MCLSSGHTCLILAKGEEERKYKSHSGCPVEGVNDSHHRLEQSCFIEEATSEQGLAAGRGFDEQTVAS